MNHRGRLGRLERQRPDGGIEPWWQDELHDPDAFYTWLPLADGERVRVVLSGAGLTQREHVLAARGITVVRFRHDPWPLGGISPEGPPFPDE